MNEIRGLRDEHASRKLQVCTKAGVVNTKSVCHVSRRLATENEIYRAENVVRRRARAENCCTADDPNNSDVTMCIYEIVVCLVA